MIEHGIRVDHEREARLGFDEAVYAAGKSTEQLCALVAEALATGHRRLFTRMSTEQFACLRPEYRDALDYDATSLTAFAGPLREVRESPVAVLTAGSSDVPPASEAIRTLAYYGHGATHRFDVGVAGLWRLLEHVDGLREMAVVIVAAGMDGALPSVVGGLLPGVVIALPTAVGYGIAKSGRVALGAALASCAPGLLTVNIDNGYGAACAALRVLRATHRSET